MKVDELEKANLIFSLENSNEEIIALAFNKHGTIAFLNRNGSISFCNIEESVCLEIISPILESLPWFLKFSPTGKKLITLSRDGSMMLILVQKKNMIGF